jgi:hypothetical protein
LLQGRQPSWYCRVLVPILQDLAQAIQAGTGIYPKFAVVVVQLQQYYTASRGASTIAYPPCTRKVPVPVLSFLFLELPVYKSI